MTLKKAIVAVIFIIATTSVFLSSCKKNVDDLPNTGGVLSFSTDTVQFDTIFTTMGSTTKAFKVYNPGNKKITIDEIRLAGGNTSQFRLNIDGEATNKATDIELAAGDSIFIFVEVTINPQSANTPFVIADSVMFTAGGEVSSVLLVAWGQDANYFSPTGANDIGVPSFSFLECSNTTWTPDKPYVIFGSLIVKSGCTLTIEAGTHVYFYKNSNLIIEEGARLVVNGLPDNKVEFGGTRLEDYMQDVSGQWGTYIQDIQNGQVYRTPIGGIWLYNSQSNNIIDNAIVKNAYIGIMATGSILTLTNTEIYNQNGVGLFASASDVSGYNNVVANCGLYSVYLSSGTTGGSYRFRHCTFANYWADGVRQTPTLMLNNYIDDGINIQTSTFNLELGNTIIYGNIESEIGFDFKPAPGNLFYNFNRCIFKLDPALNTSDPTYFTNCIKNPNPEFRFNSSYDNDYRLDTLAATVADDAADATITNQPPAIFNDVIGVIRPQGTGPDIGAYEKQP